MRSHADRISYFRNIAVRSCLAAGLLACGYFAGRRGLGAWYFQTKTPEGVQTAIRWDPHNAQYYDALAALRHFYADNEDPNEQVKLYERAATLSPQNAGYWSDLGVAYDWAGNRKEALLSLERARELFPNSPEINWRLANFYVRAGKTPEGLGALKKVLEGGGIARQNVFALAETATHDSRAILEQMIPPQTPILVDYLNFQANAGNLVAAEEAWSRLLDTRLPFDVRETFFYLDALIQKHDTQRLAKAWTVLSERFPEKIGALTVAPNLVANGSFEADILNGGLDWRVAPVEGASVSFDLQEPFEGQRSVRIEFDGTRNLDYGHLFQYVIVRPNTEYRFSGYMRTDAITTDSGPRFQLFDAYNPAMEFVATENRVGSSAWMEQQLEFKTPADTSLLIVRVARPPSSKFDNKISGTVWVDRIQLTAEKGGP